MNLTSKKTRRAVGALCSTTVVAALGWWTSAASAAGVTLDLGPNATSVSIVDTNPNTAPANSYGLKVTGTTNVSTDPLRLKVLTGPAGGSVSYERVAANGTPAALSDGAATTLSANSAAAATSVSTVATIATGSLIRIGTGATADYAITGVASGAGPYTIPIAAPSGGLPLAHTSGDAVTVTTSFVPVALSASGQVLNYAAGDNIYLGTTVPGTYTVQLFQDRNGNQVYDSAQDDATPVLTVDVKDVTAATASTSDDLNFVLTAPAAIDLGQTITATSAAALTTTDTRGLNSGTGVGKLGEAIAAAMTFTFANGGVAGSSGAPTFNGTVFTKTTAAASAAASSSAPVTTTATLGSAAAVVSTVVADNTVTTVALTTATTANVKLVTAAATVRVGTGSVTYTATATKAGPTAVAGVTVWFTLAAGSGTALTDLTANGAAVPSTGLVSAVTDATGVATLAVTSTKTANTNAYTVQAQSNNIITDNDGGTGGNQPITTTYATAAVTTVTAAGNFAAAVGGSVSVTGTVTDQWSQLFTPTTPGVQAVVGVDRNVDGDTADANEFTSNVDIVAGAFSYSVPDVSGNTTANDDQYRWTVSAVNSSWKAIKWLSSVTPASVSLTSLSAGTTFPIPAATTFTPAASGATNGVSFKAVLKDAAATALPYTTFTLTGTPGVYFLDSASKAQTSLTVRTNGSGQISPDESANGVTVFFTKTGSASVTVTAGAATGTTGAFTVNPATEAYKVSVANVTGAPGANITVNGTVLDAFGNVVPAITPTATVVGSFGSLLGAASATATDGTFHAVLVTGSNDSGTTSLIAKINGGAANPAAVAYLTTGLTLAAGVNTATATVTVAPDTVSITAPASRTGAGAVTVSGTAKAGATVDIYAKATGGTDPFQWVDSTVASGTGTYSVSVTISRSTSFVAKVGSLTSSVVATTVLSTVKLTAVALGGGKVKLTGTGGPAAQTGMSFTLVVSPIKQSPIASVTTNSSGVGSFTWKTSLRGARTIRVYYKAPGCEIASATVTVTVK
ncbi:MAG: hypothetical protein HYR62_04785 [Actinobacteria bacterium]|nr:hypothetical protein [Actinomycetota bacterium]MBI3686465.1 hypothetical protein [Actinomycetota bacterium]